MFDYVCYSQCGGFAGLGGIRPTNTRSVLGVLCWDYSCVVGVHIEGNVRTVLIKKNIVGWTQ